AIALADLTGVAGVSARALQMGFRRFRDTTPMAYLRIIRLELARAELAKAGLQGGSVATVANAFGFGHLGRFARGDEALFGELPSQTVHRGSVGQARSPADQGAATDRQPELRLFQCDEGGDFV